MTLTSVQQSAYSDIQGKLDSSGFFNTVTHDEMNDIAATLKGLSAADADAVIDEMARNGDLQRLASEANDGTPFSKGYSTDERRDLFADLAGKLDGQSLAAVRDAFVSATKGEDELSYVKDLGEAIAAHGSSQAKVDFVRALSSKVSDGDGIDSTSIGSSSTHQVDADAVAVGSVLSSLRGYYAQQGFAALDDKGMRAVMNSALDRTDRTSVNIMSPAGGGTVTSSFDAGAADGILRAAATSGDADLKARMFDAAGVALKSVRDTAHVGPGFVSLGRDDALKSVSDGMTALIDSDTTGVVRELAYNQNTDEGTSLAVYSAAMIERGQEAKLGQQMAKLQLGNALNEDPIARLDQVTTVNGQDRRENAGALGYFVGGVYAGAAAHSSSVQKQQETAGIILNSALTVVGTAPGAGLASSLAGQVTGPAIKAALEDPKLTAAQKLEDAALPVRNGEQAVGDNVFSAFEDRLTTVQRRADP